MHSAREREISAHTRHTRANARRGEKSQVNRTVRAGCARGVRGALLERVLDVRAGASAAGVEECLVAVWGVRVASTVGGGVGV